MVRKSIVLHIGTHKTGTTSLQHVLATEGRLLAEAADARYYSGVFIPQNHVELHLAAMRAERMSPFKARASLTVDQDFRSAVAAHIRTFVQLCPVRRIIFSAEGLSLLRYSDEIAWLKSVFEDHDTTVVVYLRNKADYLRSYAAMIVKHGLSFSHDDPLSYGFVEANSWLTDYDALVGAYREVFGAESVVVMNYELENQRYSGTAASFLEWLGVPANKRLRVVEPRMNVT